MAYVEFLDLVSGAVPPGRPTGNVLVRYEAPPDPEGKGRPAQGYLKPSGEVAWTHPGTGAVVMKSDQRWVYSRSEALELAKKYPDRWVDAR